MRAAYISLRALAESSRDPNMSMKAAYYTAAVSQQLYQEGDLECNCHFSRTVAFGAEGFPVTEFGHEQHEVIDDLKQLLAQHKPGYKPAYAIMVSTT